MRRLRMRVLVTVTSPKQVSSKRLRAAVAAALLVAGCGCSPSIWNQHGNVFVEIENAPKAAMDPELQQRSETMHRYLLGQLAIGQRDFPDALANLAKAEQLTQEPAPSLHGQLAELYVRDGKLPEALAEVQQALAADPDNERYLLLAGGIDEGLGRSEDAANAYRAAIEKYPKNMEAYVLLSGMYTKQRQLDRAAEVLRPLLKYPDTEPTGRYYLGHVLEQQGNFREAEEQYLKAYRQGPAGANVVADLLRLYLSRNETKSAQEFCRRVLKDDRGNIIARRVLSQILMGEKRLDEALEQLEVLTTLESDSAESRFKIALIQIERQNYKDAERELLLLLANKPDQMEARYYLASTYAAMGRLKEALDELAQIKSGQAVFPRARMLAAFLQRQQGDLAGAEQSVRDALRQEPGNKKAIAYLVLILRDRREYGEALEVLEEQLEREPSDEEFLFQQGVLLSDLGRDKDACAAMQKLLELNPDHSDALNFVAYSYAEKGVELDRALEMAQRAVQARPEDGYYLDTLGWIYYRQGRLPEAKQALRKAVELVTDDVVILEHYGDVLVQSGELEEGRKVYRRAAETGGQTAGQGPRSEEDRKARERLAEKLQKIGAGTPP